MRRFVQGSRDELNIQSKRYRTRTRAVVDGHVAKDALVVDNVGATSDKGQSQRIGAEL